MTIYDFVYRHVYCIVIQSIATSKKFEKIILEISRRHQVRLYHF